MQSQRLWEIYFHFSFIDGKNQHTHFHRNPFSEYRIHDFNRNQSIVPIFKMYIYHVLCTRHTSKCAKKRNTIEIVSFVYIFHAHTRFSIATITMPSSFFKIHSIIKYINTYNDTKRWTSHSNRHSNSNRNRRERAKKGEKTGILVCGVWLCLFVYLLNRFDQSRAMYNKPNKWLKR